MSERRQCRECLRFFTVKKDGALRLHSYGATDHGPCPGGGKTPMPAPRWADVAALVSRYGAQ